MTVPGDRGLAFRAFGGDFPNDITLVVHPLADGFPRPGRRSITSNSLSFMVRLPRFFLSPTYRRGCVLPRLVARIPEIGLLDLLQDAREVVTLGLLQRRELLI